MLRELIKKKQESRNGVSKKVNIAKNSVVPTKTENQKRNERALERYQVQQSAVEKKKKHHHDNDDEIEINWKFQIGNERFTFGLTNTFRNGNVYSIIQITGTYVIDDVIIDSRQFTIPAPIDPNILDSPLISSVILIKSDADTGLIDAESIVTLWQYDGVRENYIFANAIFNSNGELIVLSNFTGTITLTNNLLPPNTIQLNAGDGSYFMSKFSSNTLRSVWRIQLTALNSDNVHLTKDNQNNTYLTGTYQGNVTITDTDGFTNSSTSNLLTDMFVAKINDDGAVVWLFSSLKTGASTSTGFIKAESIIFSGDSLGLIGTNNQRFSYQGPNGTTVTVENEFIPFNIWVLKIDTDGNAIWMINPTSNFMAPIEPNGDIPIALLTESFVDGSQIIYDNNNYYIAGSFSGDFTFNHRVISDNPATFVAKLDTDGNWQYIVYVVADIPNSSDRSPSIAILNGVIYLGFFAFGNIYAFYENNAVVETLDGSGSLDLVYVTISESATFEKFLQICGTYSNPSYFIVPDNNSVFSIGTHLITVQNTDCFVISLE